MLILVAEVSTRNQTQEYQVSINNVAPISQGSSPLYLYGRKLPLSQKDSASRRVNQDCLSCSHGSTNDRTAAQRPNTQTVTSQPAQSMGTHITTNNGKKRGHFFRLQISWTKPKVALLVGMMLRIWDITKEALSLLDHLRDVDVKLPSARCRWSVWTSLRFLISRAPTPPLFLFNWEGGFVLFTQAAFFSMANRWKEENMPKRKTGMKVTLK